MKYCHKTDHSGLPPSPGKQGNVLRRILTSAVLRALNANYETTSHYKLISYARMFVCSSVLRSIQLLYNKAV